MHEESQSQDAPYVSLVSALPCFLVTLQPKKNLLQNCTLKVLIPFREKGIMQNTLKTGFLSLCTTDIWADTALLWVVLSTTL